MVSTGLLIGDGNYLSVFKIEKVRIPPENPKQQN
jgi:hypothetical protein